MDSADIAKRADSSIEVLLRIYAKSIAGQDEVNNRKVGALLGGISFNNWPGPSQRRRRPVGGRPTERAVDGSGRGLIFGLDSGQARSYGDPK
jgi:hypothetical protein